MADAENLLWSKLRRKQLKGYQFYRQKIIHRYIVDFPAGPYPEACFELV